MSRIGKQELVIPANTTVVVADGVVSVKGPLGELFRNVREEVAVTVSDGRVTFLPKKESKFSRSLWGTYASLVKNMIAGVNAPFVKKLIVEGVGYRSEIAGESLKLQVGFSHPVILPIPAGITATVEKSEITIQGNDKERVGQFAAEVRAVKKPEPYKGKGIRYVDEVVRRKQGKKGTA
jgi:large subunit ribosomal protein L6